jgi:hypothetical protein
MYIIYCTSTLPVNSKWLLWIELGVMQGSRCAHPDMPCLMLCEGLFCGRRWAHEAEYKGLKAAVDAAVKSQPPPGVVQNPGRTVPQDRRTALCQVIVSLLSIRSGTVLAQDCGFHTSATNKTQHNSLLSL